MPKFKVNDVVRITDEPETSINARARVVEVKDKGVIVSNLNQPFQGTLVHMFFKYDKVKKV